MLYTVLDPERICPRGEESPPCRRVRWEGTELLLGPGGRVQTILSSDPAVYLCLHEQLPGGCFPGKGA